MSGGENEGSEGRLQALTNQGRRKVPRIVLVMISFSIAGERVDK